MFASLYDDVVRSIKAWSPGVHTGEKGYAKELADVLRRDFAKGRESLWGQAESVSIEDESGRGLCDIVVNRKIGIELKKDLKGKSQIDRLIGQLDEYVRNYERVIIVLTGSTNTGANDTLKLRVSRLNKELVSSFSAPGFGSGPKIDIISK